MNPEAPTPEADSDLEELRAKLRAQRAKQKASLAKHKQTTFMAVEQAKRGTTFFDPERLRETLEAEDAGADNQDDSTAE